MNPIEWLKREFDCDTLPQAIMMLMCMAVLGLLMMLLVLWVTPAVVHGIQSIAYSIGDGIAWITSFH